MAKKNTKPADEKVNPVDEKANSVDENVNPARKRTAAEKHALQKRVRKMAARGGKGQFIRMLAMTQPVKEQRGVAAEK